jgi:hypothetical protein
MIQVRGFHREDSEDDSDDDFSDDEELQTPIDEVGPFIFFVETIQGKDCFMHESILIETFLCPKLPDKVVISWYRFSSI